MEIPCEIFGWSSDDEVRVAGGLVPVGIELHNIVGILLYSRAFECIKYVCKSNYPPPSPPPCDNNKIVKTTA